MAITYKFKDMIEQAEDIAALTAALARLCYALGFHFFALSHHIDFRHRPGFGLRLHNYPADFEAWFDAHGLGLVDPVHRASQTTHYRFSWSGLKDMIPMTRLDARVFDRARAAGIGDGITAPFCIRGQMHGSLSFAKRVGESVDPRLLESVHVAGGAAFACVTRLKRQEKPYGVTLTGRQLECVRWAMRGKTAKQIARIMKISPETAVKHLNDARVRYGASARSLLYVYVLDDGALCLDDILMEEPVWR